jgi:hypothetical protein
MSPTCHPSYPSVSAQSPESLMRPSTHLVPSTATHKPLNLRQGLFTLPYALPDHRVTSPSLTFHRASRSPTYPPSGICPLPLVECSVCFSICSTFVLCFLFVYEPGQPLPLVMDTVDSFPLMTTCRYTLPLHLIVSEQWPDHPLS